MRDFSRLLGLGAAPQCGPARSARLRCKSRSSTRARCEVSLYGSGARLHRSEPVAAAAPCDHGTKAAPRVGAGVTGNPHSTGQAEHDERVSIVLSPGSSGQDQDRGDSPIRPRLSLRPVPVPPTCPARPLGAQRGREGSASSDRRCHRRVPAEGGGKEESLLQFKFHGICSLLYSADFYMDS